MDKITQPKLFSRGNKLWIRFSLNGENIRKPLNLEDTKANRKLANLQIIPQMILKVSTGEFFENETVKKVPTVDEYMKISFEMNSLNRKEIVAKRYERLYEIHIKPHFKHRKLDSIKASDLAKWQNELTNKLTTKSIKGVRTVFNTIIDDAIRDEIISRNPFSLIKIPKVGETRDKIPFSIEEIRMILSNAKIGATWTPITEILGHLCQFYLDTKNGQHLDTFLATPINQFHLS